MEEIILPVVIASYNRLKLLKQTIESLRKNSDMKLQIIVSDSSTDQEVIDYLNGLSDITYFHFDHHKPSKHFLLRDRVEITDQDINQNVFFNNKLTLGKQQCKGAELALPSKYIYFTANDIYFMPHWDSLLIKALDDYEDIVIVGGRSMHPFSQSRLLKDNYQICLTNVQAGYSMMMRRKEFDKYGFFPDYDEDSWISYEMTAKFNKKIAYVNPPIIIHCGMTSLMNNKPYDYDLICKDIERYPEIYFE